MKFCLHLGRSKTKTLCFYYRNELGLTRGDHIAEFMPFGVSRLTLSEKRPRANVLKDPEIKTFSAFQLERRNRRRPRGRSRTCRQF